MLNFALKTGGGALAAFERIGASEWKLPMEKKRGRAREAGGLLAGRLAVKIEICTDSSMRGGGRV